MQALLWGILNTHVSALGGRVSSQCLPLRCALWGLVPSQALPSGPLFHEKTLTCTTSLRTANLVKAARRQSAFTWVFRMPHSKACVYKRPLTM